jgi:hypothetical protein
MNGYVINNKTLSLTVLETGKSMIKTLVGLVLGEVCSLLPTRHLVAASSTKHWETEGKEGANSPPGALL